MSLKRILCVVANLITAFVKDNALPGLRSCFFLLAGFGIALVLPLYVFSSLEMSFGVWMCALIIIPLLAFARTGVWLGTEAFSPGHCMRSVKERLARANELC